MIYPKLSEFLAQDTWVWSKDKDTSGEYTSFQEVVQSVYSSADAEDFPLAFACPLFMGKDKKPSVIWAELPMTELPDLSKPGITFICTVLEFLYIKRDWSKEQMVDITKRVEEALDKNGYTHSGVKKGCKV